MPDLRASLSKTVAPLTRRQLMGAVGGGSLMGSAWAAVFRDAALARDDAHVAVARTETALGVLFDHRGHRIMLIDAGDGPGAAAVTELAAGFLRQRIDAILLPADASNVLPRDYPDRWRVRDVWTLADVPLSTPHNLTGRSLRIGRLHIDTDALPVGAWRVNAGSGSPWYLTATLGRTRVSVASDADALRRLPLDGSFVNAVVCADVSMELAAIDRRIDVLAVPLEALPEEPTGARVTPLPTGSAVGFQMRESEIGVTEAS